jgi:membrane associated rhomboid family serine protease
VPGVEEASNVTGSSSIGGIRDGCQEFRGCGVRLVNSSEASGVMQLHGSNVPDAPPLWEARRYPVTTGIALLATVMSALYWSDIGRPWLLFDLRFVIQPWRLLSSSLIHIHILHLGFNLYWLWLFGTVLEKALGGGRYLLLLSAIEVVAAAAEHALARGGVGLSGIVYGLLGFLWIARADARCAPLVRAQTVWLFVFWFAFCLFLTLRGIWEVGNVAHAMGTLGGLAFGCYYTSSPARRRAWLAACVSVVGASLASATVLRPSVNLSPRRAAEQDAYFGHIALWDGYHVQAVVMLESAVRLDREPAEPWFLLGVAWHRLGQLELAADAYREAATREPGNGEYRQAAGDATRVLGDQARAQGRTEDAARLFREADAWEGVSR